MMNDMDFYNSTTLKMLEKGHAKGVPALSSFEKVVYLIVELDALTNIDGLFGFYSCLGVEAEATVDALERIGALESAEMIHRANSLFPGGSPPKEPALLNKVLNSLGKSVFKKINLIGDQFLERPDGLEEKLRNFILRNKKRFSK